LYRRWTHTVLTRRHIREREGREGIMGSKKIQTGESFSLILGIDMPI
jgi:hypothetical protein